MARKVTKAGLLEASTNLVLALLYGAFLAVHFRAYLHAARTSLILAAGMETLFTVFFVLRRGASTVSRSPFAWSSTVAGTFLPVLLRPVEGAQDFLAAQVVQTMGAALSVYGIASLNRSLGLLPANRGIQTGGAYRWVRHPLYASYTLANIGYLASNPSTANACVCVAAFSAQLVRIRQEERLLMQDPVYAEYASEARWRLLPFVY